MTPTNASTQYISEQKNQPNEHNHHSTKQVDSPAATMHRAYRDTLYRTHSVVALSYVLTYLQNLLNLSDSALQSNANTQSVWNENTQARVQTLIQENLTHLYFNSTQSNTLPLDTFFNPVFFLLFYLSVIVFSCHTVTDVSQELAGLNATSCEEYHELFLYAVSEIQSFNGNGQSVPLPYAILITQLHFWIAVIVLSQIDISQTFQVWRGLKKKSNYTHDLIKMIDRTIELAYRTCNVKSLPENHRCALCDVLDTRQTTSYLQMIDNAKILNSDTAGQIRLNDTRRPNPSDILATGNDTSHANLSGEQAQIHNRHAIEEPAYPNTNDKTRVQASVSNWLQDAYWGIFTVNDIDNPAYLLFPTFSMQDDAFGNKKQIEFLRLKLRRMGDIAILRYYDTIIIEEVFALSFFIGSISGKRGVVASDTEIYDKIVELLRKEKSMRLGDITGRALGLLVVAGYITVEQGNKIVTDLLNKKPNELQTANSWNDIVLVFARSYYWFLFRRLKNIENVFDTEKSRDLQIKLSLIFRRPLAEEASPKDIWATMSILRYFWNKNKIDINGQITPPTLPIRASAFVLGTAYWEQGRYVLKNLYRENADERGVALKNMNGDTQKCLSRSSRDNNTRSVTPDVSRTDKNLEQDADNDDTYAFQQSNLGTRYGQEVHPGVNVLDANARNVLLQYLNQPDKDKPSDTNKTDLQPSAHNTQSSIDNISESSGVFIENGLLWQSAARDNRVQIEQPIYDISEKKRAHIKKQYDKWIKKIIEHTLSEAFRSSNQLAVDIPETITLLGYWANIARYMRNEQLEEMYSVALTGTPPVYQGYKINYILLSYSFKTLLTPYRPIREVVQSKIYWSMRYALTDIFASLSNKTWVELLYSEHPVIVSRLLGYHLFWGIGEKRFLNNILDFYSHCEHGQDCRLNKTDIAELLLCRLDNPTQHTMKLRTTQNICDVTTFLNNANLQNWIQQSDGLDNVLNILHTT